MENSNYLGTEKVGKLLRQFAIPCICSLIISCLYNIVDQIFVGNGVGYLGNAATGVIFPITVVGWGLSLFFGDGAAAALSVSLGRGKTKDIHRSVGSAVLGSFLSGVVVIVIAYLWGDSLLWLIGATDANIQMAHDYGVIIFAMMPPCYDTEHIGVYYSSRWQPQICDDSNANWGNYQHHWRPDSNFCTGHGY